MILGKVRNHSSPKKTQIAGVLGVVLMSSYTSLTLAGSGEQYERIQILIKYVMKISGGEGRRKSCHSRAASDVSASGGRASAAAQFS